MEDEIEEKTSTPPRDGGDGTTRNIKVTNLLLTLLARERSGTKRCRQKFEEVLEYKTATSSTIHFNYNLQEQTKSTFVVAFSPDRTKIATSHGNHSVKISDCFTFKILLTLKGHPRTPWCVTFHPTINSLLATGCLGGQVRLWDLNKISMDDDNIIYQSQAVISSLAFHPTEDILAISTHNKLIFYNWNKRKILRTIQMKHRSQSIRLVRFLPNGSKLITAIANTSSRYCKPERFNVSTRGDGSGNSVVETVSCMRLQQPSSEERDSSASSTQNEGQGESESDSTTNVNKKLKRKGSHLSEDSIDDDKNSHQCQHGKRSRGDKNSKSGETSKANSSMDGDEVEAKDSNVDDKLEDSPNGSTPATSSTSNGSTSATSICEDSHTSNSSCPAESSNCSKRAVKAKPLQCTNKNEPTQAECSGDNVLTPAECSGGNKPTPAECSGDSELTPAECSGGNETTPAECSGDNELTPTECTGSNHPTPAECSGGNDPTPTECTGSNESTPEECSADNKSTSAQCCGGNSPTSEERTRRASLSHRDSATRETLRPLFRRHRRLINLSDQDIHVSGQVSCERREPNHNPSRLHNDPSRLHNEPSRVRNANTRQNLGRSDMWEFHFRGNTSSEPSPPSETSNNTDESVDGTSSTVTGDEYLNFPFSNIHQSTHVTNFLGVQTAVATATARSSHHVHTAVVIASQEHENCEATLQTAVNRAIAGAFAGSGEGAVANNIIDTTHRLQLWDSSLDDGPDIQNEKKNVIVPFCKIHNDSSLDISQDSCYIAVFVPNEYGFPMDAEIKVISLKTESFLHCIYSRKFGPNAVSVSLSSLNHYVMIGLASRKLHWQLSSNQLIGQILELPSSYLEVNYEDICKPVLSIFHKCKPNQRSNVSVNTLRFHPNPGMGIIYGTNRGHVQHCHIKPDIDLIERGVPTGLAV